MYMQKIRDGPGRSRELWPNVRYADTLVGSRNRNPRFQFPQKQRRLTKSQNTMKGLFDPICPACDLDPYFDFLTSGVQLNKQKLISERQQGKNI